MTSTPIFPQTITNSFCTIVDTDASALKTVYTAGANGSQINKITITNSDSATYALNWWILSGGTSYLIGQTSPNPYSGSISPNTPSYDLLSDNYSFFSPIVDACGNPQLYLASGSVLQVNSTTTVNTGMIITIFAQGGDF